MAPNGTGVVIEVSLQLVGVAGDCPFENVTVLVPWLGPKFAPDIVTGIPTPAAVGDKLEMRGVTVNDIALLGTPPTVTMILPVLAPVGTGTAMLPVPQLVGVLATPLKVTVLVPCGLPKLEPEMVTDVPTGPDPTERLDIEGAANSAMLEKPNNKISASARFESCATIILRG